MYSGSKAKMTKKRGVRCLSAILTLSILMSFFVMPEKSAYAYSGGSGTSSDPYLISTVADLEALRDSATDYHGTLSKYYKLTADIDLNPGKTINSSTGEDVSGIKEWTSIPEMAGTLDGGNHVISGIYGEPLIGKLEAYGGGVKNLGIINSYIYKIPDGCSNIGAFVADAYNAIERCWNEGDVSQSGSGYAGGIFGYLQSAQEIGSISECYNTGNIKGVNGGGGIVGYVVMLNRSAYITDCYNTGSVTATSSPMFTGGIVGFAVRQTTDGASINISRCYNIGDLPTTYRREGIAGEIQSDSTIERCIILDGKGTNAKGGTIVDIHDIQYNSNILSTLNDDDNTCYTTDSSINDGYPYLVNLKSSYIVPATITASDKSIVYGSSATALGATVDSGGTLTYSSSNTSVATIDASGKITPKGVGTTTITINAAANGNYSAATKTVTVTVTQATPTWSGTTSFSKTYGDGTFSIAQTVSSGVTPTYKIASGSDVISLSGTTVTINKAGTATITASAAANTNYKAPANRTITITVAQATPTWSGTTSFSKTYGDGTFSIAQTVSSGVTPTYKIASGSDVISLSGTTVTINKAGTATITASAAANTNYKAPANRTITITVAQATPTWSGTTSFSKTYGEAAFSLGQSVSGGGALTYKSNNTGVVTVDSTGKVTIVGAGSTTITVTAAASTNYASASRNVTINVGTKTPTITASDKTVNYGAAAFALGATVNSGGTLTYSSSNTNVATVASDGTVTPKNAGTATITITAAAKGNYGSTTKTVTVKVNAIAPTITASDKSIVYGSSATAIGASVNSGGTLTYSSSNTGVATVSSDGKITPVAVGSATITITAAAKGNYTASSKQITVTVTRANTSWKSGSSTYTTTYGASAFSIAHTAASGGAVTYTLKSGGDYITLSGSTVTPKAAGSAVVTVTAAANGNYNAISRDVTITVNKANTSFNKGNTSYSVNYNSTVDITHTAASGGAVTYSIKSGSDVVSLSGATVKGLKAGTATITVTAAATANYNAVSREVTITVNRINTSWNKGSAAYSVNYGGAIDIAQGAASGGAVSYSVKSGSDVITLSGTTVSTKKAGTAVITATAAATDQYNSISRDVTITVNKVATAWNKGNTSYSVNYNSSVDIAQGVVSGGAVTYSVKSGSDCVTLTGSSVKGVKAGTAVITATAAETTNYTAMTRDITITVNRIDTSWNKGNTSYSVNYNSTVDIAQGAASGGAVSYSVKSGSDCVTITGSTVKGIKAGSAVITATAAATTNYNAISRDISISVKKIDASFTGGQETYNVTYGDAPFSIKQTVSSGAALTYAIASGSDVVSVSNDTVTIKKAGTATITVSAAANTNYNAASRTVTINVGKKNRTITTPTTAFTKTFGESAFPIGAVISDGKMSYVSSNTAVADVDANGNVTIKGVGSANITVSSVADSNYNDAESKTVSVAVNGTVPHAPTLSANSGENKKVTLSWTPPTFTGGYPITGYHLQRLDTDGQYRTVKTLSQADSSCVDTDVVNGTTYSYRLVAQNQAGLGVYSAVATAKPYTVPNAPTELKEEITSNASTQLTWKAPSNDGGDSVSGYAVKVYSDDGYKTEYKSAVIKLGAESGGVYTAEVTGLAKGTEYFFAVTAQNRAGSGEAAKTSAVTWTNPNAPTNVKAVPASKDSVTVTWVKPEFEGGTPVIGYILYYREKGAEQWTAQRDIKDVTHTVGNLRTGIGYEFAVSAVNASDADGGEMSAVAEAIPAQAPEAPILGEVVSKNASALIESVTNTQNNGNAVIKYAVYYRVKGEEEYIKFADEFGAKNENAENLLVTGLKNGVDYEITAAAVNELGESEKSAPKTVRAGRPTAVKNVEIVPQTGQMLDISFDPSDGQGSDITGYYLYIGGTRQGLDCDIEEQYLEAPLTHYTYNAGERLNGDTITAYVIAENAVGRSDASDTAVSYVGAPSAPVLTKYVTDENGVSLAWTASDPHGNALKLYTVYITDENGETAKFTTKNSAELEMYIDKDDYPFEAGKAYTVKVSCTNVAGSEGVASNTGRFTFAAPAKPEDITGETGDGSLTVSWKKPVNDGGYTITGYKIYLNSDKEATATVTWESTADNKYQLFVNDHRNNKGAVEYGEPQDNLDEFSVVINGLANGYAYTANVTAVNEKGEGPSGGIAEPETPKTAAGAPLDVTANGISGSEAQVNWKKPVNDGGTPISGYKVTAYKVSQKNYETGKYEAVEREEAAEQTVSTGTSVKMAGLATGFGYEFEVCAVTAAGDGIAAKSNVAMTHTKPSAPVITEVESGVGSDESLPVTVRWTAPEDDGNSPIIGYDIYINNQFRMNTAPIDADTHEYVIRDNRIKNGVRYDITVVAYNAVTGTVKSKGTSSESVGITVGSVPAPKNVKVTGDRDGNLNISWPIEQYKDIMSYIDRYVIYVNDSVITTTRNNYALLTMRPLDVPQTVQVSVISTSGQEGNKSEPQTIVLGAPDKVTGVNAEAGKESITVTWDAIVNDLNADTEFYPNQYTVYIDGEKADTVGDGESPVEDTAEMKAVIDGLKGGQEYTVTVTAANSYGESVKSGAVKAVPWAEPDEPAVSDIIPGSGEFSFTFEDGSGNGSEITGHKVYVYDNQGIAAAPTVTYSGNRVTVAGITDGVKYSFYIAAVNSKNLETKAPSSLYTIVTGVPAPPANVTAVAGNESATVSFDKSADVSDGHAVTHYEIVQIAKDEETNEITTKVVKTVTEKSERYSELIDNLENGSAYTFAVRAYNDLDGGELSAAVSVKPGTPNAPIIKNITPASGKLSAEWSAPQENAGRISKYAVYVNGILSLTTPETKAVIKGLDNGSEYVITVSAYNYVGEGAVSEGVKATPGGVPEAVCNVNSELTYSEGDGCGIVLTWDAPEDDGGLAITQYKVSGDGKITVDSEMRKAVVTGLERGTDYTFDIIAHSDAGDGEVFTTDRITTFDVPDKPTLIGGNSYNNSIIVTWEAPSYNGGSDITEYKVYAEPIDGGDAVVWSGMPKADANGEFTAVMTENLVTNKKYNVSVAAVNAVGESGASSSTRVQVNGNLVQTKPSEPINVQVKAGDGSAALSWSAPVNDGNSTITSYVIWAGSNENDMGVIASVDGYTFTYTENNLKNGVERFYKVKAVNGVDADGGEFSEIVSAVPIKINVPSAPVWPEFDNENGVSAYETNAQGTEMKLNWMASTGDALGGNISYEVYVNGEKKDTVTDTSYVLRDIKENVRYNIQIKAVSELGGGTLSEYIRAYKNLNIRKGSADDGFVYDEHYKDGAYANIDADYNGEEDYRVSYDVPSAPENAKLTKTADKAVVTWDVPLYNGNRGIDGYYVYVNGKQNSVSNDTYSYEFDIKYAQPYTVYVKAYNSIGTGEATDLMYITPSIEAPSDLKAEVSDKVSVELTWTIGNDEVTSYVLYVNGAPERIEKSDVTVTDGNASYTYNGEINRTYNFALSAKYDETESVLSNTYTVSTDEERASAPLNVRAEGSEYNVTVSWNAPENAADVDIEKYYIYVNGDKFDEAGSNDTEKEIIVDGSCVIKVAAVCGHGVEGELSESIKYSVGTEIDYGTDTPPAPINAGYDLVRIDGILNETDNITVKWEAGVPDDKHTEQAESYNVTANGRVIDNVSETECTFTVEAGKDYNIIIEPVAANGKAGPKSSIAVVVPANEYPAPQKPVLKAELNSEKTAVTLTWTEEADVEYYLTVNGALVENAVKSGCEYSLSSEMTNYTFRLTAVKTYGEDEATAESEIVTVSTLGDEDSIYGSDKPVITGTLSYGAKSKVYWTAPVKGENEKGDIEKYAVAADGVEIGTVNADASPLVYMITFDSVTDSKTIEIRAYKNINGKDFVASVSDPWIVTPNCNVAENENDFNTDNTDGEVTNKDTDGDGKIDAKISEIIIPIKANTSDVSVDFIDSYGNIIKTVKTITDSDGSGEVVLPLDDAVKATEIFDIVIRKDAYTTYSVTGVPYEDLSKVRLENVELYAGDVNGDGKVDSTDRLILNGNIGNRAALAKDGDINNDGKVDSTDRLILNGNIGKRKKAVPWSN